MVDEQLKHRELVVIDQDEVKLEVHGESYGGDCVLATVKLLLYCLHQPRL